MERVKRKRRRGMSGEVFLGFDGVLEESFFVAGCGLVEDDDLEDLNDICWTDAIIRLAIDLSIPSVQFVVADVLRHRADVNS